MNPNLPPFSFPNGNASDNQSSDNNNNPSQPSSNTEPTVIPQSTTPENSSSTSVSAQDEARQREIQDTLEPTRSAALGKKVRLIAARRTGRVRGSQQNSNFEPTAIPQSATLSNNSFENNNSVLAQSEVLKGRARDMFDSPETARLIARAQRFGTISTNDVNRGVSSPERPNLEYSFQGTDNHIGQSHVHRSEGACTMFGNRLTESFCCITGTIKNHCLDEMRAKDYFNLKQDLLSPVKKQLVGSIIARNTRLQTRNEELRGREQVSKVVVEASQSSQLSSFTTNPQFGHASTQVSASLLSNNDQSKTIENFPGNPSLIKKPQETPQANIQQKKNKPKKSVQPVEEVTIVEAQEEEKGEFSQQTVISSNPGSFGYEMNKMLFFSGLSQAMEKHNLTVPEHVLDETDFCAKFVEFLGQYEINLPTENVPQFELDSIMTLMKK